MNYGTSFMMAAHFNSEGPEAYSLVTYSQSAEPDSPWHADQTKMFGEGKWKKVRFREAEILAAPGMSKIQIP